MLKYPYFLIVLLFVLSCGVRQPVDITNQNQTGSIFVQSAPAGAFIFIDGINTQKLTPDTLTGITVGSHMIHLSKNGYVPEEDSIIVHVSNATLSTVHIRLKKLVQISYIYIQSQPSGANIFVDDQSSGKVTPDTIRVEPGVHRLRIEKNGFVAQAWSVTSVMDSTVSFIYDLQILQRILFESFGNVSCEPCVTSAKNLERFRVEHPQGSYALMEYYAFWPNLNDPFYKVSPDDIKERISYYSVSTLPQLRSNGATGIDAADYEAIVTAYTNEIARQQSALALSVNKTLNEDTLQVRVEVYDFNHILPNDQLRLFVAVSEDDIHYDSPPGSNGLKDFNFVFRRFLSDRKGDKINSDRLDYRINWPGWNYGNSHVIAFVQDISTKKIIQTTIN